MSANPADRAWTDAERKAPRPKTARARGKNWVAEARGKPAASVGAMKAVQAALKSAGVEFTMASSWGCG